MTTDEEATPKRFPSVKYLGDWFMFSDAKQARLEWCDEEGVHGVTLPAWLLAKLTERAKGK